MEQTIEVGSISFFVANPIYGEVKLSDEDSETLAKEFEDEFRYRFSKSEASNSFTISSVEWKTGCLDVTIFLGVLKTVYWVVGGIGAAAAAYPKVKKGLLEIQKDIPWLRSKRTKRLHPVRLHKDELYSDEEIIKAIEDLRSKEK
jgi:hypothetical protein